MAEASLQDRLRKHSEAFDSLLSLIPAKIYYGEDTSDQWKRKKQSKDQAKAARRGRLDPDSELNRTAKDVLDERARNKRKAQEMEQDDDDDESNAEEEEDDDDDESNLEGSDKEKPGQGLKKRTLAEDQPNKKAKLSKPEPEASDEEQKLSAHQEKKLAKLQKKLDKRAEKKKNKGPKPAKKAELVVEKEAEPRSEDKVEQEEEEEEGEEEAASEEVDDESQSDDNDDVVPSKEAEDEVVHTKDKMRKIHLPGLVDNEESSQDSTPHSPTFDTNAPTSNPSAEVASTTTSIASEATPLEREGRKQIKVPADNTEFKRRLAEKIAAMRAARKADGPDGKPIKTRQDLIESRRKKAAQSKEHKKELRRLAKEAEDQKREEALASARNSPMLSFGSPSERDINFSFGRVAFADGTTLSRDLTYAKDKSKKKGPLDPKSALAKVEAQKARIEGMDDEKKKKVLEQESWLAASRRAVGEKVRNDVSLLKKAAKRVEKTKNKSAQEWNERKDNVEYAQKKRQEKRENNIKQRRDEKLAGKAGKKSKGKPTSKKSRPGFEGGGFGGGKRR